ncbi:MAG TPA: hypothetical protein VFO34_13415 [Candidatus Acidoferrales bacterium]|nr:hypothetical protein [Candidatus Acidoferrales bacterium]
MLDLSPQHVELLERIGAQGFSIVAFPLYAQAVGIRRGDYAVLLKPEPEGAFSFYGEPFMLIDGNPGVRVKRGIDEVFVWKSKEIPATPEPLVELAQFRSDLERAIASIS